MILSVSVLGLLWAATAGRVPTLWRDGQQRALWSCLCAITLAKTTSFPAVAERLESPLLPHLFGVLAVFSLLRFIMLVTGRGGGRWQLAVAGVVLAVLGGLALASGGIVTDPDELGAHLGAAAVVYWVVLEAYLGTVLVTASVLFWRIGRDLPGGPARLGLWAMAAGAGLVTIYAAVKSGLIVAHGLGAAIDFERFEGIAKSVQASGVLIAVAGAVVPAGRRARAAVTAYVDLIVLRPLWTAMRDAFPEVILFTPRRAVFELAGVDDVHLRLYRRVIEIRDGMLALRPYLPDAPAATGPAEEAARIAEALRRRAEGAEPADRTEGWAPVGPEMADEVAWLRRVSRAFKSPGGAR